MRPDQVASAPGVVTVYHPTRLFHDLGHAPAELFPGSRSPVWTPMQIIQLVERASQHFRDRLAERGLARSAIADDVDSQGIEKFEYRLRGFL